MTRVFRSLVARFRLSLVTQFMSRCISRAQARVKCVSVFLACDAPLFVACDAVYLDAYFGCAGACKVRVSVHGKCWGRPCACIFPYKVAPSLAQVSVKLSGRVLGTGTVHASCSQTCHVANTCAWCTGLMWGGCDNVTYACVTRLPASLCDVHVHLSHI